MDDLSWYWRRLCKMSAQEIAGRLGDAMVKQIWRVPACRPLPPGATRLPLDTHRFRLPAIDELPLPVGRVARQRLCDEAERVLDGTVLVLGMETTALGERPDWFVDISSGRCAPRHRYSFDIPYRDAGTVGQLKYVLEPSRHHHLTLLAAAYYASGDERFARRVADHLRLWWRENPFLQGIHWTSGIEIGLRLIGWIWLRRLLARWDGAVDLFEANPDFIQQLYHHQVYLARLRSRGSSANNHTVAEIAGLFAASSAFPIFLESAGWRHAAARLIVREIEMQTFPDGLDRELATAYHGLVLELFLVAAAEDDAAAPALDRSVWQRLAAMMDTLAAIVDRNVQPPHQGDDDGAFALVVDATGFDRWRSLLATGDAVFGRGPWWPELLPEHDLRAGLLSSRLGRHAGSGRPGSRPNHFVAAGMVLLRDFEPTDDELWCRFDAGPLGYLATAAHGHADAMSIELRCGGIDILSDPGTYCYHGQETWRAYFRSTLAHNTLELDGSDQCRSGGLFLWRDDPRSELERVSGLDDGDRAEAQAAHYGYERLANPAVHRRLVRLDRRARSVEIIDSLFSEAPHAARLAFHLGPRIECRLEGDAAHLCWTTATGRRQAVLNLPNLLGWSLHRGETDPVLGWYSRTFGVREPSFTLLGRGRIHRERLCSRLVLATDDVPPPGHDRGASRSGSDAFGEIPG